MRELIKKNKAAKNQKYKNVGGILTARVTLEKP